MVQSQHFETSIDIHQDIAKHNNVLPEVAESNNFETGKIKIGE